MPPIPPKRKRSLLNVLADQTRTPGYQPPPMATIGPKSQRPRMSLLGALEQSVEGYGDTPQEFVNSAINPLRQGRQARELVSALAAQVRRTGRTRDVGDAAGAAGVGGLLAASMIPGIPDEVAGKVRFKISKALGRADEAPPGLLSLKADGPSLPEDWWQANTQPHPLDPKKRLVVRNGTPVAAIAIERGMGGKFFVNSIQSLAEGGGREGLAHITSMADRSGATLMLSPVPFGAKAKLSAKDLKAWYARHGFSNTGQGDWMSRAPGGR